MSCAAATSPSNSRIFYYATPNNQLRRKIDRGANYPPLDGTVDSIEIINATTVRLHFRNDDPNWGTQNGRSFDAVMQKTNDCWRTLSATADDGTLFVKDGHFTSNGSPAPLLEQCAD